MMFYATKKSALKKAEDYSLRNPNPIYVLKTVGGHSVQAFEQHDEWEEVVAVFQNGENKMKK